MEWRVDGDIALLVAIADGTVSIYFATGSGVIGAGQHESARRAAEAFLNTAEGHRHLLVAATQFPLPRGGRARFHHPTFEGELTAEAEERDLAARRHALAALFYAAQDVITAIRELSPGGPPTEAAGPPQRAVITLVVSEPPDYQERVVAEDPDPGTN
jgi:hypothetical protein